MMKNWKISERTINIGDCYIDSGFDRMGSVRMSFSDFVSLNEYECSPLALLLEPFPS